MKHEWTTKGKILPYCEQCAVLQTSFNETEQCAERKITPRGFEDFCEFTDERGNRVVVRASSVFPPTCVHLFCTNGPEGPGRVYEQPYLTRAQARQLAEGLLRFADSKEGE